LCRAPHGDRVAARGSGPGDRCCEAGAARRRADPDEEDHGEEGGGQEGTGRRSRPTATDRDLERQLAQGPPRAGRGVARRGLARRAVRAGDQARRRRVPGAGLRRARLRGAHHGQGRWNGVAILSRSASRRRGPRLRRRGIEPDPRPGCSPLAAAPAWWSPPTPPTGGRSATSSSTTSWPGSTASPPTSTPVARPDDEVVVCGDLNVAPEDRDVWDVAAIHGATHVTPDERDRFQRSSTGAWSTRSAVLPRRRPAVTWWDYRAGNFHKHKGMRIDHVLASRPRGRPAVVVARRPQRPQGQYNSRVSSARAASGARRPVRHQTGLDPADHDGVPLAPLGGVERRDVDADVVADAERIGGGEPGPQRHAVAERLLAEEVEHRRGAPRSPVRSLRADPRRARRGPIERRGCHVARR
jgi:hypothetical protein